MSKIKAIFSNFKRYWFLMTQLISRDFKVKYNRSVLGILWSLLNPILTMTVMAMVMAITATLVRSAARSNMAASTS